MKTASEVKAPLRRFAVAAIGTACLSCIVQAQTPRNAARSFEPKPTLINVTVSEGTSMAVAVSPDGKTLAIDLQGSIWTLPAAGGTAKRITNLFNDARQPVWSPDGRWRPSSDTSTAGTTWTIAPDGSKQQQLTWGSYDDCEPAYSHDGRYLAFSSDRDNPLGSSYNIWILDLQSGEVKRATNDPSENHMPTWSPDDKEIAFSSTRDGGHSI